MAAAFSTFAGWHGLFVRKVVGPLGRGLHSRPTVLPTNTPTKTPIETPTKTPIKPSPHLRRPACLEGAPDRGGRARGILVGISVGVLVGVLVGLSVRSQGLS